MIYINRGFEKIEEFVRSAQHNRNVADFPFGTYQKCRPGEFKNEFGRQSPLAAVNSHNIEVVKTFVSKHRLNLDFASTEPAKFIAEVKAALINDYTEPVINEHKSKHRQEFRFFEGIASYIEMSMVWGAKLLEFRSHPDHTTISGLRMLLSQVDNCVLENVESTVRFQLDKRVVNSTSQAVSKDVLSIDGSEVLIMLNASAGCISALEDGGGAFGDPFYSLTTQEENRFRSFPFYVQLFVQFFLAEYVETEVEKEHIKRFVYLDNFSPKNGKCLVLKSGREHILFSAAYDNSKLQRSEDDQTELARRVFRNAFLYASKNNINRIVAGAFGIGVFRGSTQALIMGVDLATQGSTFECQPVRMTMAYLIRPTDKTAAISIENFNMIAEAWHCEPYSA